MEVLRWPHPFLFAPRKSMPLIIEAGFQAESIEAAFFTPLHLAGVVRNHLRWFQRRSIWETLWLHLIACRSN